MSTPTRQDNRYQTPSHTTLYFPQMRQCLPRRQHLLKKRYPFGKTRYTLYKYQRRPMSAISKQRRRRHRSTLQQREPSRTTRDQDETRELTLNKLRHIHQKYHKQTPGHKRRLPRYNTQSQTTSRLRHVSTQFFLRARRHQNTTQRRPIMYERQLRFFSHY